MVLIKAERDIKAGEFIQLNHPDVFSSKGCVAERYNSRLDGNDVISITRTVNETEGLIAQHKNIIKHIETLEEIE